MRNFQKVELSGWQGGTYGFRVGSDSMDWVLRPIRHSLTHVRVVLPGHNVQPICRIADNFWTSCPEGRSVEIGRWMRRRREIPWPKGSPPHYIVQFIVHSDGVPELHII